MPNAPKTKSSQAEKEHRNLDEQYGTNLGKGHTTLLVSNRCKRPVKVF